jgi:allantoinase
VTTDRLTYPHRHAGLDHDWFAYEPTHRRPPIVWPSGKQIALWITVPVEFFALDAPSGPLRPLGALDRGYPDFWSYSNRDYGLRIGIYRIMRVLDNLGLRATAAVNSAIATRYPRVIHEIVKRDWEIAANGVDMGRVHYGKLPLEEERAMVHDARDTLRKASGQPVTGWYSPGQSQSSHTLPLLAQENFQYVTDWANDDLPYKIRTAAGELWAMPYTYECSDRLLLVQYNRTVEGYEAQILRAFHRLQAEAETHQSGRLLSLSISPWILGYPHRIGAMEQILGRITETGAIWAATGTEIVQVVASQTAHQAKSDS